MGYRPPAMHARLFTLPLPIRLWLLILGTVLTLGGTMLVTATWRAVAAHVSVAVPAPTHLGYEADDHFPGAAALYLAALPAGTPGTTGTVPLPALPASYSGSAAEAMIVPARPFALTGTPLDRSRALQCLTDAIYYEAASEPDAGQRAVAQVVLNRVRHPAFPGTVCGVVYQGSERGGCQFSFACDGALARVPARAAWARAANVAAAALAGYVFAPVGLATHYHTYAVTPAWNRTLVMTDAVGAHFFHRWKGYWGTAAAFTQIYRGAEPAPGPHAGPAPVPPITLASTPAPPTSTTILPAWQGTSIAAAAPAAPDDHLPPASQVLDRWKDSGKPL
jgi:Cell Wall Hydrolase